ncbi:hypothetical protein BU225_20715, partial [Stenotrophomonas sp. MB339]|uniref:PepSY-associated TM helix domain-containing protein n=1 Tax=Stenotrophomonas sp. MB339 TaxID=1663558 RepID=UPI0009CD00D7
MSRPASSTVQQQQNRGFWLRTLHQWHWISPAVCLIGMLLFAVTGLTLNPAAKIEAKPEVQTQHLELPAALPGQLGPREDRTAPMTPPAHPRPDARTG